MEIREGKRRKKEVNLKNQAITLTFGDRAEYHRGMQIIGESAENGFSLEDLKVVLEYFKKAKGEIENNEEESGCRIVALHEQAIKLKGKEDITLPEAYLLIILKGSKVLINYEKLVEECVNYLGILKLSCMVEL